MLQGFHHIAISCADIDKSIAFYTAIGGTVYRTWGEGKSRACMIGFGKENYLELFANGAPGRPADQNVVHFAFRSTDTAADFAKAIAAGAVETKPVADFTIPSKPEPLSIRFAFCRGLDGEIIEFFQIF
jgi:glyoxylase I family protein